MSLTACFERLRIGSFLMKTAATLIGLLVDYL